MDRRTCAYSSRRALVTASRQRLAGAVHAELTWLYWTVGQRLASEVLGGERAGYGARLLDQLGQQLAQEFGRGFESRNLRRMVKLAEAFPDVEIVSTLSTPLSWSHLVAMVALKTPEARAFLCPARCTGLPGSLGALEHSWIDVTQRQSLRQRQGRELHEDAQEIGRAHV